MDLSFIPDYLRPFIATQDTSLYTPIDHAAWRFILKVSQNYFSKNAHSKYLNGLKETGISTERIPLVTEMDACLSRFGWRAVPVSGFIPPSVFMEFQSLGILPIACEMRTLDHLAYTPAPDIVHEAAGHAPIIADPEYAQYLRAYGEVSRKAIFSSQDMALYEAIRNLSIVKEEPESTPADIQAAQTRLDETAASVTYVSEATLLARMNWWTVEYGLVGALESPRIYGAGLLSSLGESYSCLKAPVRKVPLTVDCVNTIYDITKPQPQLFVTPDFQHLTTVLHEFARTMAFKVGGSPGLAKALQAATVCTAVLDSGVQISGVVSEYRVNEKGEVTYLKCSGPTQLAHSDQELEGQGPEYHTHGFSTAIGLIQGTGKSPADLSDSELHALKPLRFESGVEVQGDLKRIHRAGGTALILSFENCTVKKGNEILFRPEWGTFDLAAGARVVSVFGGAADRKQYLSKTGGFKQSPMRPKCNLTPENESLNTLYAEVRTLREKKVMGSVLLSELERIEARLESESPADWLLRLEILELLQSAGLNPEAMMKRLHERLAATARTAQDKNEMITRGLELLEC